MSLKTVRKVPEIRFKGFQEEWDLRKICELVDEGIIHPPKDGNHGEIHPKKSDFVERGIPFVMANNVRDGELVLRSCSHITREQAETLQKGFAKAGDVLLTHKGTVGETAIVGEIEFPYIMLTPQVTFYRILEIEKLDTYFLVASFTSNRFQDAIAELSGGGTRAYVGITQQQELSLTIPTDASEQTQIGAYFKSLNRMIKLLQRKHDKLVTLKQAMLQKMFPQDGANTPDIRFKGFEGDWHKGTLGECTLIQRGGSPRPIEDFITNRKDGVNWVKIGDVKPGLRYITATKEKIKPEGVGKSREVFKGDLILSNSMSFGRPYIMGIDGCIHDGWLLIRNDKSLFELEYLQQYLGSERMLTQYSKLAGGGGISNLNSELVKTASILFPSKPEQQKIGTYFRTLHDAISKHATQLEKLKNIKSACLEKMFV